MNAPTRRAVIGGTLVALAGCSDTDTSGSDGDTNDDDSRTLEEKFESAARNHENHLVIWNVDEAEDAAFVDFMSTADTVDGRAEELSTLLGVYGGVIESGEEIPGIIGYGLDPDLLPETEETMWSFRAEQQWVEDWANGVISGDEAVQMAADTYEENTPPGE